MSKDHIGERKFSHVSSNLEEDLYFSTPLLKSKVIKGGDVDKNN